MSLLVLGVDLAQQSDFTAITVVEAIPSRIELTITEPHPGFGVLQERDVVIEGPPITMQIRWLDRVRGLAYPKVVNHVADLMRQLPTPGLLVIDATGVGRPVVDMVEAAGLQPFAITITGGTTVNGEGRDWRVPKVDLVSALMVAMQTDRLKIAPSLALTAELEEELKNFKLKFNPATMHESYGSWRESEHDDLVLASALAVWVAEREFVARAARDEQALYLQSLGNDPGVLISPI